MKTPQGDFDLLRHEQRTSNSPLRAWDAADELLLRRASEAEEPLSAGAAVVVNDRFGALACGLATAEDHPQLVSWSDSWSTHQAMRANLVRNDLDPAAVVALPSTEEPSDGIGTVLLKIPKSLALLEDQLCRLAPLLSNGTTLVAGAMVRHIHRSTLDLFERLIGPTTTSLATRKARLIFSTRDSAAAPIQESPWPREFAATPNLDASNHAGVFSLDRLDVGTRLLLDNLPSPDSFPEPVRTIVDLGCGSGVLGTALASSFPEAMVVFVDDSYLAVASAEATFTLNGHDPARGRFEAGDCLLDPLGRAIPDPRGRALERGGTPSIDLIVSNPPFHEDHSVGDAVAWQMFTEARQMLRPGGQLVIVGNRHLGYHAKLKRIFGGGRSGTVASNRKFVVLSASVSRREAQT